MTRKEREEAITTIKRLDHDFGDYEPNHKVFENILSALRGFEGMTNGEVIKALFSQIEPRVSYQSVEISNDKCYILASKKFWDSPYKGVSE